jgi:RNA polymerase sigma factor (sigma-70 family)
LLDLVRDGEETAFTELYARHREVALRMAAVYAPRGESDDLVDLAFEKVLGALRRGRGPDGAFRAYLFVTLRRLAAEQAERRPREQPLDELPEAVIAAAGDPDMDPLERQMITSAFESLPGRWQAVLWHTAVEGRHPRELASILGVSANAVSALAYRAREKLRQAYLQAHLRASPHPECEPHRSSLGAFVREGQSRRERRTTLAHVDRCPSCQTLVGELNDVNRLLARAVLPIFMATGVGGKLATLSAGSHAARLAASTAETTMEGARRGLATWARAHQVGTAVGAIAAGAALLVGLAEVQPYFSGGHPEPARATDTTAVLVEPEPPAEEMALAEAPPGSTPCTSTATDAAATTTDADEAAAAGQDDGTEDDTAPTTAPTPTTTTPSGGGGLGGLVQSLLGALGVQAKVGPAQSPLEVLCTPVGDDGQAALTFVVGGDDTTTEGTPAEGGLLTQLPAEATVTIDLTDGLRLVLQAGLPPGCELTDDGRGLRCLVSSLLPGAPAAQIGVEVAATDSQLAATITVSDGHNPILTQTVDLSAISQTVGGLLSPSTTTTASTASTAPSLPLP